MISKEDKTEFNELIELLDTKYNYPYVDMLKRVKQYINTPTPLDSEVEKAIKGLESMADWYVDANDYRDKFAQERLEKYINIIHQALQDKQSQLNQVREVCKLTVVNQSFKRCNEYFSYEAIEVIKQILGDDKE